MIYLTIKEVLENPDNGSKSFRIKRLREQSENDNRHKNKQESDFVRRLSDGVELLGVDDE